MSKRLREDTRDSRRDEDEDVEDCSLITNVSGAGSGMATSKKSKKAAQQRQTASGGSARDGDGDDDDEDGVECGASSSTDDIVAVVDEMDWLMRRVYTRGLPVGRAAPW